MAQITVTEVTDPFCTWCWGAEPVLRRIEETYRDQVEFEFVMGGLIEDFEAFYDEANDIQEPRDVAPHWEEAASQHGMPVDADVWREDPPLSSYPANVAYEAAEFQGVDRAHDYLRRLREAVAVECRNISRRAVLVELAGEVGLDVDRFVADLDGEAAREAFEADRRFLHDNRAYAFPSFRVATDERERWIRGFRPYEVLDGAIADLAPELTEHDPRPIRDLVEHHGRLATREVAEVHGLDPGRATQSLRALAEEGALRSIRRGNGYFWEPATDGEGGARDRGGDVRNSAGTRDGEEVLGCRIDGECAPGGQ